MLLRQCANAVNTAASREFDLYESQLRSLGTCTPQNHASEVVCKGNHLAQINNATPREFDL